MCTDLVTGCCSGYPWSRERLSRVAVHTCIPAGLSAFEAAQRALKGQGRM